MRVYLGGPMRGHPNLNYQAFEDAAFALRAMGHDVLSPHEIDLERGWCAAQFSVLSDGRKQFTRAYLTEKFSMETALLADIRAISASDAVAFIKGWRASSGCAVEDAVRAIGRKPRYSVYPNAYAEHGWVFVHDMDTPSLSLS